MQKQFFCEPAREPHLQLALDPHRRDVLVRYEESDYHSCRPRARAYYLFANLKPAERRQKPDFVDARRIERLPGIPVFAPEANGGGAPLPELYAIAAPNSPDFRLLSRDRVIGEFALPVYKDGYRQMQKALLSPFAVGADATAMGGVLGLFWLYGMAEDSAGR